MLYGFSISSYIMDKRSEPEVKNRVFCDIVISALELFILELINFALLP